MADNLTHSWSASGSQGRGSADTYTWTQALSTINAKAKEKIPAYSKITGASLYVHATHDPAMSLSGTVKGELRIRLVDGSNNNVLSLVENGSAQWKPKYIDNTINMLSNGSVKSQTSDAGYLSYGSATKLWCYSKYTYTWNQGFGFSATLTWTYNEPRVKVTVNGGTGSGTYQWGSSYTIKATVPEGYRFVKWSDGNTNASRTFTVNSSLINAYETQKTYTAEFEKIPYTILVECRESVTGEKCTVTGGGTYHLGDTVTIEATNFPAYHMFSHWVEVGNGITEHRSNPLTFTLDSEAVDNGNLVGITFYCELVHYGYIITSAVLPDSNAGVVECGVIFYDSNGNKQYTNFKEFPEWDWVIPYEDRDKLVYRAVPNQGYKFVKWADGNTENPREYALTGDTVFTAIFEKLPLEFTSAEMKYLDKQISTSNKVICGEGFIISVGVT